MQININSLNSEKSCKRSTVSSPSPQHYLRYFITPKRIRHKLYRRYRFGNVEIGEFSFGDGAGNVADSHSVGRVDSGGIERFFGEHFVFDTPHREY